MQSSKTTLFTVALWLFASANAHMIMNTPKPFGQPNNSPLEGTGSDYPCKVTGGAYPQTASTPMALGAEQTLNFTGSAVHGGGSCQLSITYDKAPTKDSKFKVIHSIIGGCPSDVEGNLTPNAEGKNATSFKYSIPKDLPTGEAVLAWTWFNKIGNREMYMNCAPITITGATSKRARFTLYKRDQASYDALPDMFKANIPVTECTTEHGKDVDFPNPGVSVQKGQKAVTAPPSGSACGASGGSTPSTGSPGGSGSAPSSGSPSSAPSQAPAGGSSGSPGGTGSGSGSGSGSNNGACTGSCLGGGAPAAAPVASSAPAATGAAPSAAPSSGAAAPSGFAPPAGGSTSSGSGSSSGASASGTCSAADLGKSLCSPDGKMIGMCDQGGKIAWGPVASGLVCKGGYQVAGRSLRFAHRRRQHGSSPI